MISGRTLTWEDVLAEPIGTQFDSCLIHISRRMTAGYHFTGCRFIVEPGTYVGGIMPGVPSLLERLARGITEDPEASYRGCIFEGRSRVDCVVDESSLAVTGGVINIHHSSSNLPILALMVHHL